MKLVVAGVATNIDRPEAKNWMACLEYLNLDYVVLGVGQNYAHHGMKRELLRNYVNNSDADVIILSDVYDVIPNKYIKEVADFQNKSVKRYILDLFRSYNYPIVASGERICGPFGSCYQFNGKNIVHREHIYPNGGIYMGYRDHLIEMFDTIEEDLSSGKIGSYGETHDQYTLGYYAHNHPYLVYIEKESHLFNNNFLYNKAWNRDARYKNAVFTQFPGMQAYSKSVRAYNAIAHMHGLEISNSIVRDVDESIIFVIILVLFLGIFFLG